MFNSTDLTKLIFGRLTWESLPLHEPILVATFAVVALGGIALLGAITYFRLWGANGSPLSTTSASASCT
jgi:cytochrome o ubiquinol oxidase subunit 1